MLSRHLRRRPRFPSSYRLYVEIPRRECPKYRIIVDSWVEAVAMVVT
jgi:hypothetical protein